MAGSIDSGIFVNYVLSLLLRKLVVPGDYHNQVKAVKEMLSDDSTGLVDSLTDFAVDSATVDFSIETSNENFTKVLKKWLDTINIEYRGQIPSGIKPLAKEYFKERWKGSSFPILRVAKWGEIDGVVVPTKLFFVDGGSFLKIYDKRDAGNVRIYVLDDVERRIFLSCIDVVSFPNKFFHLLPITGFGFNGI